MKDDRLKEQLFRNIREALIERNDIVDCDVSSTSCTTSVGGEDDLCVSFAKNFTLAGGTLHYCYNESDIRDRILEIQQRNGDVAIGCASENLDSFLGHLKVEKRENIDSNNIPLLGSTLCEALIAQQGTIVISSNLGLGTTIPSLYETTIVLAFTSQVVPDWQTANERLKQLYPQYPNQIMVANPGSYACRKGKQKIYLILIEDEAA